MLDDNGKRENCCVNFLKRIIHRGFDNPVIEVTIPVIRVTFKREEKA